MKFSLKKKPEIEEEEVEIVEEKKPEREKKLKEEKKDPTRFVSLILLVVFLFISYIFWIQFPH